MDESLNDINKRLFLEKESSHQQARIQKEQELRKLEDKYLLSQLIIDSKYYNEIGSIEREEKLVHQILNAIRSLIKKQAFVKYGENVFESIEKWILYGLKNKIVLENLDENLREFIKLKLDDDLIEYCKILSKVIGIVTQVSNEPAYEKISHFVAESFKIKGNDTQFLFNYPNWQTRLICKSNLLRFILAPDNPGDFKIYLSDTGNSSLHADYYITQLFKTILFKPYTLRPKKSSEYAIGFYRSSTKNRIHLKTAQNGISLGDIPLNIKQLFTKYSFRTPWPPTLELTTN